MERGATEPALPAALTIAIIAEMTGRFCDELSFGFGWMAAEPTLVERASHALVAAGRVWLVDPIDIDGLDERLRALGRPAGVVQLVDRHGRDSRALAERYDVPLHVTPFGGVPGSPFELVRIANVPGWREVALWWPAERVLVVGDALGTASYFLAPGEAIAVHPLLRALPPRALGRLDPEHILCGHGEGVHGQDAAAGLEAALQTSRRRVPRWLLGLVRNARRR